MNFSIHFRIYSHDRLIRDGEIIVKRADNRFTAQCKLHNYLHKKHPEMTRMEVVEIKEVLPESIKDIFGKDFGDIFK
jgi:hypothetical protein